VPTFVVSRHTHLRDRKKFDLSSPTRGGTVDGMSEYCVPVDIDIEETLEMSLCEVLFGIK
jgi:hypothetical protein